MEVVVAFYSGRTESPATARKLDNLALLNGAVSRKSMYYKRIRQTIKADGQAILVDKREYGKQAERVIGRALSRVIGVNRVVLLGYGMTDAEHVKMQVLASEIQHHTNIKTEVCLKAT